jgi:hypothetical protein
MVSTSYYDMKINYAIVLIITTHLIINKCLYTEIRKSIFKKLHGEYFNFINCLLCATKLAHFVQHDINS